MLNKGGLVDLWNWTSDPDPELSELLKAMAKNQANIDRGVCILPTGDGIYS